LLVCDKLESAGRSIGPERVVLESLERAKLPDIFKRILNTTLFRGRWLTWYIGRVGFLEICDMQSAVDAECGPNVAEKSIQVIKAELKVDPKTNV
jgi:hypothetical protein